MEGVAAPSPISQGVGACYRSIEQEAVSHHLPSITAAHGGAADANAIEAFVDKVAPHIKV